jgi:hypothetical protein
MGNKKDHYVGELPHIEYPDELLLAYNKLFQIAHRVLARAGTDRQ